MVCALHMYSIRGLLFESIDPRSVRLYATITVVVGIHVLLPQ